MFTKIAETVVNTVVKDIVPVVKEYLLNDEKNDNKPVKKSSTRGRPKKSGTTCTRGRRKGKPKIKTDKKSDKKRG